jgi:two-component system osmolarity sensor histidine kinase EnvZ
MTDSLIKRMLPRSLLGRSLLIIISPLVLLQLISAGIFYESHWDKVSRQLARGLAGDVAALIDLRRRLPDGERDRRIVADTAQHMDLTVVFGEGEILAAPPPAVEGRLAATLARVMVARVGKPFQLDFDSMDRHVIIKVQLADGVLKVVTQRKRLFSSTTYVFVLWMVGTSMLLFAVAVIFMRNQVKPINRLAEAADEFGKGRDVPAFKPEGAMEVRKAAAAFIAMRDRLQRQISQRTDMLAGVSHDLRTPLTRMKLQLAMLDGREGSEELLADVAEMEHMLQGYLAFARGEGAEPPRPTELNALLEEVVAQAQRRGGVIDLHTEGDITVLLRPSGFKRCLTNLIENALRYAGHVSVTAGERGDSVEITVDDDGPGIPEDQRDEVFRPFYRLEGSRNPGTGGIGLGLSIARDIIRGHGGDITLGSSPGGGLRARLVLPR